MIRTIAVTLAMVSLCACSSNPISAKSQDPITLAVGERPRAISVGDLNGDGRNDIAVANADSNTFSVLIQSPDSTSFTRTDFPAGNEPSDIELGDFDHDGDLDAAFANHETSMITILSNDGSGRFSEAAGSPFETEAKPHLHGLAVGDFDNDGWLDIAADSSGRDVVVVLRGGEKGFALDEPMYAGSFPYYRIDAKPTPIGAGILVPSPKSHRVSLISPQSMSSRSFSVVGDAEGAMMAIDANLDGDANRDVVAAISGAVAMWVADRNGYKVVAGTPVTFEQPTEITAGDIDGDGMDEIAVGLWGDDKVYILSSSGKRIGAISACARPAALAIADLNGDGNGEVIAGCWNDSKILIFDAASLQID